MLLKRMNLTLIVYSQGQVRLLYFMASNRCIPFKSTLGYRVAELHEGEVIFLCKIEFPVDLFYMVRCVHVFECRLVINSKHNKRRPVTRTYHFSRIYIFFRQYSPGDKGNHEGSKGQSLLNVK